MGALIALIGTLAVGTLVGWFIHWLMHQRWTGRMHRSHMTHHLKLYPHQDLLSDQYRDAGTDNGIFLFAPGITLTVLIFGGVLYLLGISLMSLAIIVGVSTIVGVLHDQVHTAFHLNETVWNRSAWFRRLRALHFYHHRNMRKNLGIMSFVWDRILGTFRKT